MKTTVDTLTAVNFLSNFFAGTVHNLELRALQSNAKAGAAPKGRICSRAPQEIASFLTRNSAEELYFGVATRQGGGGKEHCRELTALYCDIDGSGERLDNFNPKPSVIISSGGGLHPYWLLETPIDTRNAQVEPILKGFASRLGADAACAEIARVLRVPGTYNHKSKYGEPQLVRVIRADWNCRYSLEDFAVFAQMSSNGNRRPHVDVSQKGKIEQGLRYTALIAEMGRLWQRGSYSRELTIKMGIAWARENFELPEGVFDEVLVRKEIEHLIDSYEPGNPARPKPVQDSGACKLPSILLLLGLSCGKHCAFLAIAQ